MEIAKTHDRLDIIDNNIDWSLGRAPVELFTPAKVKNYFFWVTEPNVASPAIRILFTYDSTTDTVHLVAAKAIHEGELIPD